MEHLKYDAIVCTTNGVCDSSGCLVMGAGIAKDFKMRYPWLPAKLGGIVKACGNHCYVIQAIPLIISCPTKQDWKLPSTIGLILKSAQELADNATDYGLETILMTRLGCGCGGLDWRVVCPRLEKILDNRFTVISLTP
jgi:hypothetical protein